MPRWRTVKFTEEWNGSRAHAPGAMGRGAAGVRVSFVMPSTVRAERSAWETGPSVVVTGSPFRPCAWVRSMT
ncbi:hypothetical protein STENM327S_00089 [Streptomyces tendae]